MMKLLPFALLGLFLAGCETGVSLSDNNEPITASETQKPLVDYPDPSDPTSSLADRGWGLVWSDEFNGDALDRTKWAPEISCWGGGNDERQCYLDRLENIEVSDGYLHLKAVPGEVSGPSLHTDRDGYPGESWTRDYSSGKLRTRDLASWTFGRIEGRMKLPQGQGAWPAFWMMPQDDVYGSWPLSGEIDIMEAVNLGAECFNCDDGMIENRSSGAIHFGPQWPNNDYVTKRRPLRSQAGEAGNPREQFHTYAVEWGAGRIDWFVNGDRFWSVDENMWFSDAIVKSDNPDGPFDESFYVMLNFAVGGAWPEGDNEKGVDPDVFPSEMLVDYVRVYQCAGDIETGRACMMPD